MREVNLSPMGYEQVTGLSSVKGLTIPAALAGSQKKARMAIIQATDQNVRWRDDGTNPSATVGVQLAAGSDFLYTGDLSAIKFIEEAASAKVNVSYYH